MNTSRVTRIFCEKINKNKARGATYMVFSVPQFVGKPASVYLALRTNSNDMGNPTTVSWIKHLVYLFSNEIQITL